MYQSTPVAKGVQSDVPKKRYNIGINFLATKYVSVNASLMHSARRQNNTTTTFLSEAVRRWEFKPYDLFNLTIRSTHHLLENLEASFSIYNLFDEKFKDDVLDHSSMTGDMPRPGRQFYLMVMYRYL
jgi:outer membrane receptor for ferrienterochelin and colicin